MFKGTLKPYQVESVEKMVDRKQMLVAFEMGTGKTVMTISAIEELVPEHTLVVCLSSLKYQWKKEVEKFSDSSALVIDGTPKQRNAQYSSMKNYKYIIVNYEQVVNDWEHLSKFKFNAIVCDEATAIKGFRSKRAKKVKELSKSIPIRYALTGTPIENGRPEELYSIMEFVDPKILGRFDLFDKTFIVRNQFGGVQRYRNLPVFHQKMQTVSVRKTQNDPDVAPFLPAAVYRDPVVVKMDPKSANVYRYIAEELHAELIEAQQLLGSNFSLAAHYGLEHKVGSPEDSLRGSIMSKVVALRMLCDHPYLLTKSAKNFLDGYESGNITSGSQYAASLSQHGLLDGLVKSTKLDSTVQYIKDHLDTHPDAKAVVFTSYVDMVGILSEKLGGVTYTGKMDAKQKEKQKEKFMSDPSCRVFISSDAGGYGVDLPISNLIVNYDLPWSAGLAVQRNGRIKRASSRWPSITVQDMLVQNSIEVRQWEMLQQKNAVSDAIIDGSGINSKGGVDLTVGSLVSFIQQHKP